MFIVSVKFCKMNNIKSDLKRLNLSDNMLNQICDIYIKITKQTGIYRAKARLSVLYSIVNLLYIRDGIYERFAIPSLTNKDLCNGYKIIKIYVPEFRNVHEDVKGYITAFTIRLNIQHRLTEILSTYVEGMYSLPNNKKQIARHIVYKWISERTKITKKEFDSICDL